MTRMLTTMILTDPNAIVMRNPDTDMAYTAGVIWESHRDVLSEWTDLQREFRHLRYKYIASMGINIALMFLATWATQ